MLVVMPGVLEVKAASDLLRRARLGSSELLGGLDGGPLLVVDLDSGGDPAMVEPHRSFPGVVLGIGHPAGRSRPPMGVDLALTEAVAPPAPWVEVADVAETAERIARAVRHAPRAGIMLAQVLRGVGWDRPGDRRRADRHRADHSDPGRRADQPEPGHLVDDLVVESLAYSTLQAGPEFAAWLGRQAPHPPPGPDAEPAVLVERSDHRMDLTFNRPGVRNAYGAAARDQLCEALSMACADQSISQVHLHGAGPDFCSGGDLTEFGTLADPASAHLVRTARSAARLLSAIGERVVAHLHGACVGAGIELPALAGRVVAAPGTWMQLPELAMGLIPGAGGTASLPRRIGRHRTAWMALSGSVVDAPTALAWGLVDELCD